MAGFDREFHLARLAFDGGELLVADTGLSLDQEVRIRIHARDVSLTLEPAGGSSILNILPARVLVMIPDSPARVLVRLAVGESVILAAITHRSAAVLDLEPAGIFMPRSRVWRCFDHPDRSVHCHRLGY